MDTSKITPIKNTGDTQETPAKENPPRWPLWATRALGLVQDKLRDARRFIDADPSGVATLLGAAVGTVLTLALGMALFVSALGWLIEGNPARDLLEQAPVLHLVTDPIGHWLAVHTTGLPITAHAAAGLWGGTGLALFIAASYHHFGAKVLWPVYGLATAAMAWAGTDTSTHRPVIVGLLAIAWTALSLIALRTRRPKRVITP